jgi:hypothetical protein
MYLGSTYQRHTRTIKKAGQKACLSNPREQSCLFFFGYIAYLGKKHDQVA